MAGSLLLLLLLLLLLPGPQIAAELEEVCFFINLFCDDAWQPWTLEFFYQVDDDQKRLEFLQKAEVLQLYCEVKGDVAFKKDRWLVVAEVLLHHPFYSDKVLAAVTLSAEEQEDMLARLGSRDLAAEVDESTIIHLLLRADSINRNRIDRSRLKVEKILPQHIPDGSLWRRTKLLVPCGDNDTSSSGELSSHSGVREIKYWWEVQRAHWHNRIGNLILLQFSAQSLQSAGCQVSADFDSKLAYYRASGSEEHFPDFSGGVVSGNYGRDKFSPEEGRTRHGDILSRLAEVLKLCQW
eukprot:jgi/Chrzof1/7518/Cz02g26210.t1